jgi:LuxR family maltose regulon positive regulatory protein
MPGEAHARRDRRPGRTLRAVAGQASPSPGLDVPIETKLQAPGAPVSPLLQSKITVPGIPGWGVRRPRLDDLITQGTQGPLTSVTGPPGAGKTMAITLWATARTAARPLAWVTLDDYDNEPKIFWSYLLAALDRAGVGVPPLPPAAARGEVDHAFLLQLAAVLAAQDPPVVLVLDDLHVLTEPSVLDGLAYVLRSARPGLHLLASSRMDPLLPLHRYRLAGELTEVRADHLAFTVTEAAELMAQHRVSLPDPDLERLTRHTEGWAAGIRLAALSLDGHPDPGQFIKEFGNEDSAITGYLVDEVLSTQSPATRKLLLRTSILDRVSADLADDLTGDEQAWSLLPGLAQTNAFVQPLGHGWYRYHALFGATLRLKLRRENPGRMADLHWRAAQWFRRNGWLSEAVRHAGESGDWQLAARIVVDELAIGRLLEPQANEPLTEAFQGMPPGEALTGLQPLLVRAALELSDSRSQPGETSLGAAENLLGQLPADAEVPARLAAALIRLARSRQGGDQAVAADAAGRAQALLALLPDRALARHPGIQAQVLGGYAATQLWAGRVDAATVTLRDALSAMAGAAGAAQERADCRGLLALAEALRGRLSCAAGLAGEPAEGEGGRLATVTSPATHVALARVHLSRGELKRARNQLKQASVGLRARPDMLVHALACLVAAYGGLAGGRPRVTQEMAGRARHGWSVPPWLEHRLAIAESQACAAAGDVTAAIDWASRADPENRLDAAATLAHAWLAAGNTRAARQALANGPAGSAQAPDEVRLAAWLADARLSYCAGDQDRGRRSLGHALRLGRTEQLRLPFALERSWLRPVLRRDPELGRAYHQLLGADLFSPGGADQPSGPGEAAPLIVEQLSGREREVLQHLSAMMSTAEIAAEMYISVNTVKTHLKSIYRKLAVAHRNEAVRRARLLELL